MQKITARMRIFAEAGAPTVAMSATATAKEVEDMVKNLGLRKNPVVLREASMKNGKIAKYSIEPQTTTQSNMT